jgi:hypothetical protein
MKNMEFYLGGDDDEMRAIKALLEEHGYKYHCKGLQWGDCKTSAYPDLRYQQPCGCAFTPDGPGQAEMYEWGISHKRIAVELEQDIKKIANNVILVDHHNDRSGEPPAIIQVCDLIEVTPTREQCLVGAMDAGYVYGLEAIGATTKEIKNFLGGSNEAETVRDILIAGLPATRGPEIREVEEAVENAEHLDDLIIVRMSHSWTAPVTAMLHGVQKEQNFLILSEWKDDKGKIRREANYYATGAKVAVVNEMFPGGWTGGAGLLPPTKKAKDFWTQFGGHVPNTAFWGCNEAHPGEVFKAVMSAN